jgi:hypothetical protein
MIRDIHIHMRKEGKRRSSTWIGNWYMFFVSYVQKDIKLNLYEEQNKAFIQLKYYAHTMFFWHMHTEKV